MFKEKFQRLIQEISSFSPSERIFILCAMFCGFFISAEYAVIRPVSNAFFLTAYGHELMPYAWIAVVPLNIFLVSMYNKYLLKLGCFKMFFFFSLSIAAMSAFSALFLSKIFSLPFIYYVWKEVYVLIMFQQLWSLVHSTIKLDKAKYLYGLLFAMGGMGGLFASIIPSFFAVKFGSENLLFMSVPLYAVLCICFYYLVKNSSAGIEYKKGGEELDKQESQGSLLKGIKLISQSKFLIFILLIVALMQITSTIVYYQFNTILDATVPGTDLKTEYCARIMGIVNLATIAFQLFGCFVLVHYLGLRLSHILVPITLCVNAIGCLFYPNFAMISIAQITIKVFDFSIFGVIKEMLYIPLSAEEKFQAKSVIDVFVYRTAKAFASMIILGFQFFNLSLANLSLSSIALFAVWTGVVFYMFQMEKEPAV